MPARRVVYDPAWDAQLERLTGEMLSPSVSVGGTRARGLFRHRRMFDRDQRLQIEALAIRLGIEPQIEGPTWLTVTTPLDAVSVFPRWNDYELFGAVVERTKDGVQRTTDAVPGDPFCLFLTGTCADGHAPWETTVVGMKDGGVAMDEHEGKEQLAQMRANFPVCDATLPSGDPCGKPFATWSSDMTRMSVFRAKRREAVR